jgi:hypothetical protein
MKTHVVTMVIAAAMLCGFAARGQQGEGAAEGDPRGGAVVLAVGDAQDEKMNRLLSQAAGQVATEKGYRLVAPERVDAFVGAMERPPESEEELASVGKFLGGAAVVMVSADKGAGGELALLVRVVPADGKAGREKTRTASRASAPAQVRAMVREILPAHTASEDVAAAPAPAPKTAIIGAMPTAPGVVAAVPEEPVPAEPVPVEPVPVTTMALPVAPGAGTPILVYVGPPAPGAGSLLAAGHTAPPRPSDEELSTVPPGRYPGGPPSEAGKVMGVFGVTAGVQAGLWFFSFLAWGVAQENRDSDLADGADTEENYDTASIIAYIYLGVAPALSSLPGWAVGNRSRYYDSKYGPVVGGAYVGSVCGLGLMFLGFYARAPETAALGYVFGPILLPAAGAAIGYALGRTVEGGVIRSSRSTGAPAIALSDRVEWTLPQPIVAPSMDGSRGGYFGLSMGTLSF